jgi:hypothetical protein
VIDVPLLEHFAGDRHWLARRFEPPRVERLRHEFAVDAGEQQVTVARIDRVRREGEETLAILLVQRRQTDWAVPLRIPRAKRFQGWQRSAPISKR